MSEQTIQAKYVNGNPTFVKPFTPPVTNLNCGFDSIINIIGTNPDAVISNDGTLATGGATLGTGPTGNFVAVVDTNAGHGYLHITSEDPDGGDLFYGGILFSPIDENNIEAELAAVFGAPFTAGQSYFITQIQASQGGGLNVYFLIGAEDGAQIIQEVVSPAALDHTIDLKANLDGAGNYTINVNDQLFKTGTIQAGTSGKWFFGGFLVSENQTATIEPDTTWCGSHDDVVIDPPPGGDTTPPVITLLGQSVVNTLQGNPYVDEGATALDDTDGDITANIVTNNGVDSNTPGVYQVAYNVMDTAGNSAVQVVRTVNVVSTSISFEVAEFGSQISANGTVITSQYASPDYENFIDLESGLGDAVLRYTFPSGGGSLLLQQELISPIDASNVVDEILNPPTGAHSRLRFSGQIDSVTGGTLNVLYTVAGNVLSNATVNIPGGLPFFDLGISINDSGDFVFTAQGSQVLVGSGVNQGTSGKWFLTSALYGGSQGATIAVSAESTWVSDEESTCGFDAVAGLTGNDLSITNDGHTVTAGSTASGVNQQFVWDSTEGLGNLVTQLTTQSRPYAVGIFSPIDSNNIEAELQQAWATGTVGGQSLALASATNPGGDTNQYEYSVFSQSGTNSPSQTSSTTTSDPTVDVTVGIDSTNNVTILNNNIVSQGGNLSIGGSGEWFAFAILQEPSQVLDITLASDWCQVGVHMGLTLAQAQAAGFTDIMPVDTFGRRATWVIREDGSPHNPFQSSAGWDTTPTNTEAYPTIPDTFAGIVGIEFEVIIPPMTAGGAVVNTLRMGLWGGTGQLEAVDLRPDASSGQTTVRVVDTGAVHDTLDMTGIPIRIGFSMDNTGADSVFRMSIDGTDYGIVANGTKLPRSLWLDLVEQTGLAQINQGKKLSVKLIADSDEWTETFPAGAVDLNTAMGVTD